MMFSLLGLPALSSILCFLSTERVARRIALASSFIGAAASCILYLHFSSTGAMQYAISWTWIPSWNVHFALGIDSLSFWFVILSKLLMPLALIAALDEPKKNPALWGLLLLLDTAMTGTFLATDAFLFYVFWEASLIPMFFVIGLWGSKNRIAAAVKFFVYTFSGSVLMLAALLYLITQSTHILGHPTTSISQLYHVAQQLWLLKQTLWGLPVQDWILFAFLAAFAIKTPLVPVHTWLPLAHVEAPAAGSILLAGVLLKMGIYGMLRFAGPICIGSVAAYAPYLRCIALAGILYGAWAAYHQTDMKKLVAYSSVSHMGFVFLGLVSLTPTGLQGAVLQMFNHGISTGALFFLVGCLYHRRHTRDFSEFGGLAQFVPWFSVFFVIVAFSSMGVPGLNGFVGEFLILLGSFYVSPWLTTLAVLGVIFAAAYILLFVREVLFGVTRNVENKTMADLKLREWLALTPMVIGIIVLGLAPRLFLRKIPWNEMMGHGIVQDAEPRMASQHDKPL